MTRFHPHGAAVLSRVPPELDVPSVPQPRNEPSHDREVVARRRLFAFADRVRNRSGARWDVVFQRLRTTENGGVEELESGTETFDQREAGVASMLVCARKGSGRTVVKGMVRVGRRLLCTHREGEGASRRISGFTVDAELPPGAWPAVAKAADYDPPTGLGRVVLRGHVPDGIAWMDEPDVVFERPRKVRADDPDIVRRIRFRKGGEELDSIETWWTRKVAGRPAKGRKAATGPTTSTEYLKETFRVSRAQIERYPDRLPVGCRVVPAPDLPIDIARPIDARVRKAMERWNRAWSRPLSISATVDVEWTIERRETGNRNPGRIPEPYHAECVLRRPGKVRVDGASGRGALGLAVGDGERVAVRRTVSVQDPERPWSAMAAAGAMDSGAYLDWFFAGPPDLSGMDTLEWVEAPDPDSGAVRPWLMARVVRAPAPPPGQRASVTIEELRIAFGDNDLPSDIWWTMRTRFEDLTDADQPPAVIRHVRWSRWALDAGVDERRFRLP